MRPLILVELEGADGVIGHGEAAPLTPYDGVSADEVLSALSDCRRVLAGADHLEHSTVLAACAEVCLLPQALAAIDMALWDLSARRDALPLWRLLGASAAPGVEVNWTIGATDRDGAARGAGFARREGFTCVKVKVGVGDDAARLAAVRATGGPRMAIRLDANGLWSAGEAVAALRALAPVGLELCEEPCSGQDAMREVWSSGDGPVPLAIDETTMEPGALTDRCCDAVCLKVARCGGITGLLAAAERARRAGYEVYLASTFDGPLGIAAALHAAAVAQPDRPCGLATLALFEGGGEVLPARAGRIEVPDGAGLGDGLVEWYGK